MRFEVSSPTSFVKRRRFMSSDPIEAEAAKARLAAISGKLGREIRVFMTSAPASASEKVTDEEPDDFYEFTPEDYFRMLNTKKEDKFLKTRKIREAEQAARRSRATKAIIRVRFPDNYTLEGKFHPSETFQSLIDLLMKAIARPDLPFYIYTTPPKKQIKDMSQDFFSANFVPGAIVYFSYDLPQGDDLAAANSGPFLLDEIQSLNGLDIISEPSEPLQSATEPAAIGSSVNVQEPKSAEKKPGVPKWFKR
ncbi:Plant ubx domain-containing protein [Thalictrum thalictroides]|uniref:Plant ubx domain-containing protein n=1 Tax=Thalictrum thalictroides TaxID=46969 RepID=A0A7J6UZ93_THATH|nr:Plant ubx domain-containing protein [Thalictrum thalictroides]